MALFKQGQSGNPGGRKKITPEEREFRDIAREHTPRAMRVLLEVMDDKGAAASARITAAVTIIEHGHGKAIARSEISLTRREIKELDDATLHAIASGEGAAAETSGATKPDRVH